MITHYRASIIKVLLLTIIVSVCLTSCKQYAKFETTIHKENATKDGIYLNDYVVKISYDSILKLDNKKVIIKGRYTIVKGLNPKDTVKRQGRSSDTKHILNPKIKIIESK
tara:strand:- start:616 stop:945 length:330 start_codon:yes stop_codon:yes gene_type:complete